MSVNKLPVINCISNIVTANDCANVLLAAGFSPIMADEPQELEDIAAAANALVINLGTPSDRKYEAARAGGLAYNALHKPVIIDPVGVAVSGYRRRRLKELLATVHPDVIRCNLSEAGAILGLIADDTGCYLDEAACSNADGDTYSNADSDNSNDAYGTAVSDKQGQGAVDQSGSGDTVHKVERKSTMHQQSDEEKTVPDACGIDSRESSDISMQLAPETAKQLARSLHTVVLISGAADVVSDGVHLRLIEGGSDRLKSITGAGCMLSALCGGFAAAAINEAHERPASDSAGESGLVGENCFADEQELIYEGICAASNFFKRAAELAESRLSEDGGTGELRMRLIDACASILVSMHLN